MHRAAWSILLLVACKEEAADPGKDDPISPSPYVVPEEDPPTPDLDLADLAAIVQEATLAVSSIDSQPVFAAYDQAMTFADYEGGCPTLYTGENGEAYWYASCSTDGGASFDGYGQDSEYWGYDFGDGQLWDGTTMYAQATIRGGGSNFTSAGYAAYWHTMRASASNESFYSNIGGNFAWDGGGVDGTWLADGMEPTLTTSRNDYGSGQVDVFYDGSVTGGEEGAYSVAFFEVYLASEEAWWPCNGEPQGMISVRDSHGYWYDILFDGAWDQTDEALCDGCGEVWWRGEPLGNSCPDFGPWLDGGT